MQIQYGIRTGHRLGLIKDLEKVQMRATKLVVKSLTYKDRLKRLKLSKLLNIDVLEVI